MDFSDYKIKINLRTMCLYEQLSGKSFFAVADDDVEMIMYCSLISNNDIYITYDAFHKLMSNKAITKWMYGKYAEIAKYNAQFRTQTESMEEENGDDSKKQKVMDIVSYLIVVIGLPPAYVYDEMQWWEIASYISQFNEYQKDRLIEQRLWTYLTILPHIDAKKCKSPEKMFLFPWEMSEKTKRASVSIENNKDKILQTLGTSMKANKLEEEDKDGKK